MNATNWLEGHRVLDFTRYLSGPACTRLLAEMGAEVIKVEGPPYGDPMRAGEPRVNRRSGAFIQQNRLKKSLCLDIGTAEGRAIIFELLPTIDIVVENFSPGVMARLGLAYDDLKAVNDKIIMASVSGFGQDGPLSELPSYDFVTQAYGGVMHMTGDPDGPPTFAGFGLADTNAGVHAFAGLGYALLNREKTGQGTHLDVSMLDAVFHMHEYGVQGPSITKGEWQPMRAGRHYQPLSPGGTFKAPDGWVVIFCAQAQIAKLFKAMGQPELLEDQRFATNSGRLEHRELLTAMIEDWLATFPSMASAIGVLEAHRVPAGPVMSPADAIDHPAFIERGTVRTIDDEFAGPIVVPGFPFRYDGVPINRSGLAPKLGQHNEEILSALGKSDADQAALGEAGITFSKDR